MLNKTIYTSLCILFLAFFLISPAISAQENSNISQERMALYQKTEALTQIPWYYLAAIDQYERNTEKDKEDEDALVSITFTPEKWYGPGNSTRNQDEKIITFFGGFGKDGNGDGKADPNDPEDVLYSMANFLLTYGNTEDDIKIGLWNYYQRDLTVQSIVNNARVFKKFADIDLTKRDFPVSTDYNYSYQSTWGDTRGFGGVRIHEGTDIFADYGTPVKATTYGVVELKGWNLYGGWRIGIRDIHNIYHYYGHLSGYNEDIEVGDVVKPGDELGSVGSTGYGPPGTSGKFPPHLHYGMYKDNGHSEWSFDPYPYLKKWERMEE